MPPKFDLVPSWGQWVMNLHSITEEKFYKSECDFLMIQTDTERTMWDSQCVLLHHIFNMTLPFGGRLGRPLVDWCVLLLAEDKSVRSKPQGTKQDKEDSLINVLPSPGSLNHPSLWWWRLQKAGPGEKTGHNDCLTQSTGAAATRAHYSPGSYK